MKHDHITCVLVVDQQDQWRELAATALRTAHFCVRSLATYDVRIIQQDLSGGPVDLVVLGCARIDAGEVHVTSWLADRQQGVLVLCGSLLPQMMRSAFLAGALDVVDKPYSERGIVDAVSETLERVGKAPSYW
jgi:DNA-binding NtrC family response regulator